MIFKKLPPLRIQNLWLFFILTFMFSWLFWIIGFLLYEAESTIPVLIFLYIGGVIPPIVAILLIYMRHTPEERRDYFQRVIGFKWIGTKWYAVIFLTAPVLAGLGAILDVMTGGKGIASETAAHFTTHPLAMLLFAVFMLLFGPLPEELAWRGYALEQLQKRWNALAASLFLGTVWTVWHLPLFLIPGSYQHGLGLGTEAFWLFMADKIPLSVLMTWVYNNNRRSTLSAVLFHFSVNFVGELFQLTTQAKLFYIIFYILAAIVVTVFWGPQKMVRKGWNIEKSQYGPN
ncbi:CPBP family intramembrane glutamic endopeptidase [Flexilinea flocculi]|jgi:membrane protease YdiL (CAAX protease family)|uniref:Membrane protease YdiL, CAAX protease family n=1 Tax=Flexilinea flocculi TaxID=1678840 RepID=A0A0S7BZ59_9CHLR|nr:type II CAAX endopeptidase family protein [Flexilinea flocculi]GAP41715.1 membrane protease YdiL, CAAX protease family [Flexilinea flocculi]